MSSGRTKFIKTKRVKAWTQTQPEVPAQSDDGSQSSHYTLTGSIYFYLAKEPYTPSLDTLGLFGNTGTVTPPNTKHFAQFDFTSNPTARRFYRQPILHRFTPDEVSDYNYEFSRCQDEELSNLDSAFKENSPQEPAIDSPPSYNGWNTQELPILTALTQELFNQDIHWFDKQEQQESSKNLPEELVPFGLTDE